MKNNTKIRDKIYKAQCIGNVEPIEFMIPYPSMRSLIEGQNIKYAEQVIIENPSITNLDFFNYIQRTANWLESLGAEPKRSIFIPELHYPQSEILLYGTWQLGAVAVLPSKKNLTEIKKYFKNPIQIDNNIDLFNEIKSFPKKYNPLHKPNLNEEALITFETGNGIKLSHYNLLVNANGIQKALKLDNRKRFYSNLRPTTSSWAVFQAILPIYSGCIFDKNNPNIIINGENSSYKLRLDLENIEKYNKNDFAICPANTAALSLGSKPIHLTEFFIEKKTIKIKGHSVMMGYLENTLNDLHFKKDGLYIKY